MRFRGVTHSLGMPDYIPLKEGYWTLGKPYWTRIYTSEGILHQQMDIGWVTDKRSGSRAVDIVVPKTLNADYDAIILSHDFFYSGHVSRQLADFILLHGMMWAGISSWRAHLAYAGVRVGGATGYFDIDEPLTAPYEGNRLLEHFTWEPK